MQLFRSFPQEVERTIYAIAGLPIAMRGSSLPGSPAARTVRAAFARRYWRPASVRELGELIAGLVLAPVAVPLAALWFTMRNGPVVQRREGKSLQAQFLEQLRLYLSSGIVGPWYYILSLHRDGARRAPTFLQRCETKRGLYALLRDEAGSPLGQKDAFADHCAAAGIPAVASELILDGRTADQAELPNWDLFVKPAEGCGGKGAERWDRVGERLWSNRAVTLSDEALIAHLRERRRKLLVQRRVQPHRALEPLTSGALPTVRLLTCLDEKGGPEAIAAVFRMSFGRNRIVDNIHAGGLACAVSLADGMLGKASDLGMDARLGWCSDHPTTGARIEGMRLPCWDQVLRLATAAHRAFADRILVGWDIAITDDGPIIIEGNRGPDMDLMQRFMEVGFCGGHRFVDLLAHHLMERGHLPAYDVPASLVFRMDAAREEPAASLPVEAPR